MSLVSSRRARRRSRELLLSFIMIPGKAMEQLILEIISRHMQVVKVIWSSQHGFTKQKLCLTNLITFYDKKTNLTDGRTAVDIVYLDFRKAFDPVCNKILRKELSMHELDEQAVRWIENCLNSWAQRFVISGTRSNYINWTPMCFFIKYRPT